MDLPSYQDLDKEQDAVYNLPLAGKYLIVGPPGSGKTVVAVHRASRFKKVGERLLIITHQRVLWQYVQAWASQLGLAADVVTFHTWFRSFYKKAVGVGPPEPRPFKYIWNDIHVAFGKTRPPAGSIRNVLIDEGQDLPPDFYQVANFVSENLTIFADENQRLTEDQSTITDIKRQTGIASELALKKNYRNTRQIAELAAAFYCGLPTGIPLLPERTGEKPEIRSFPRTYECVDAIKSYENSNTDRTIGVFVPTLKILEKMRNRLNGKTRNPIQYYDSSDPESVRTKIDFKKPGIFLCCYPSAKGLEFDTVFLPEMQASAGLNFNDVQIRMKMYVMISRARQRLFISYVGETPACIAAFPKSLVTWKT